MSEHSASPSRYRQLSGVSAGVTNSGFFALASVSALFALDIQSLFGIVLFLEQYLGLVLGIALANTFLCISGRISNPTIIPWHDWGLALMGLCVGLFVTVRYPSMAYSLSALTPDRLIVAGLAILLILEATRRLLGWSLVIVAVVFLAYAKWAYLLPGVLYGRGSSAERIAAFVYFDTNGVFGIALAVGATIVAVFVLFGHLLHAAGGGAFFTNVALALLGRFQGGPAKVAIMSSALFGTMSGSAVSNVVISGSISIPMMKSNGYRPSFAAATEAAASTGGQIMPPVMGVAAFIIAENLSIPYGTVAVAAIVPAMLYFMSLFVQVDLEARKAGIPAMKKDQLPRLGEVLWRQGIFLLPLLVLIYALIFARWSAEMAGLAAVGATLLITAIKRPPDFGLRNLVEVLVRTGRTLLDIIIVSALAGIIIGALQLSGLGFGLSLVLTTLAANSIYLLLIVTAIVCIVLGMGMPTTVIYVMLAVMIAPALVQVGIEPLAAHLFIFFFGLLSMVTPPVCMATIAAAALGRAPFWSTALTGVRLSIVGYVIPFAFVFHPGLLLQGSSWWMAVDILAAIGGVLFLSFGCAGYLLRTLWLPQRAAFVVAGLGLIAPSSSLTLQAVNVAALVGGCVLVGWLWRNSRRDTLVTSRTGRHVL